VCVLFNIPEYRFLVPVEIGKPIKSRDTTAHAIIYWARSRWLIFIVWKWRHSIGSNVIDIFFLVDKLFIFILQVFTTGPLQSFAMDQIYIRKVNEAFVNLTHVSMNCDSRVGGFVVLRWIKCSEAVSLKGRIELRNICISKNFKTLRTSQIDLEMMIWHQLRDWRNIFLLQLIVHSKRRVKRQLPYNSLNLSSLK